MTAPNAAGVAAANAFWAVFWTPSARPAQTLPARSATAGNASPFVLEDSTVAATSAVTASTADPDDVASASTPSTAAIPTARRRIGPGLLPARSDHQPPTRP